MVKTAKKEAELPFGLCHTIIPELHQGYTAEFAKLLESMNFGV